MKTWMENWTAESDPIIAMLLRGNASTAHEAAEKFLNDNLDAVVELVNSPLPDEEFRRHPLIMTLLSHGSRPWEDSLL